LVKLREHPDWKHLPVTFEFWTTAPISTDALALSEKVKSELRETRYGIALRGPEGVYRACLKTGESTLLTAYEKHFMPVDGPIPPVSRPPRPAPVGREIEDWDDW
jgi:hypothetical protein